MNDIEEFMESVPNLDCFIDEQELKDIEKFCQHVAKYCYHKAIAMCQRREGNIPYAIGQEAICDRIYRQELKGKVNW